MNSSHATKKISIVIVNWNSGYQLFYCLKSIHQYHDNLVTKVIIVDNGSVDNSISLALDLSNSFFEIIVIRNKKNMGFGAACNQGAKLVNTDYILFLNPDTMLFPKSIDISLNFIASPKSRNVGIVGLQLLDSSGLISKSCSRFPTLINQISHSIGLNKLKLLDCFSQPMTEWDHSSDRVVNQVIGAFFMVKRTLFEQINGFDERFFVYYEEVDFSYQAAKLGWTSVYLTNGKIYHEGGGASKHVKAKRLFYSLRSKILYCFKNLPLHHAIIIFLFTISIELFARLAYALSIRSKSQFIETFKAYLYFYSWLFNSGSRFNRIVD